VLFDDLQQKKVVRKAAYFVYDDGPKAIRRILAAGAAERYKRDELVTSITGVLAALE
jgi:hypothetical protein